MFCFWFCLLSLQPCVYNPNFPPGSAPVVVLKELPDGSPYLRAISPQRQESVTEEREVGAIVVFDHKHATVARERDQALHAGTAERDREHGDGNLICVLDFLVALAGGDEDDLGARGALGGDEGERGAQRAGDTGVRIRSSASRHPSVDT